jgi:flagellar hook-associated protein 2
MQSILTRTQQIAQVPVTALQNDQATLKSEAAALASLQSAVGTLSSTISFLGSLSAAGALTVSSDDTGAVSAAISGSGATAGTYTVGNITSLASVSMATMTTGVADPATTTVAPADTNTLYLSVGGTQTPIVLTAKTNNLNGLRDAIDNSSAGVMASILTTSQGSYLTLTATVAGASAITLKAASDGSGTDLMSMNNTGALAQFEVNGKAATSTSNQVTGYNWGESNCFGQREREHRRQRSPEHSDCLQLARGQYFDTHRTQLRGAGGQSGGAIRQEPDARFRLLPGNGKH